MHFKDDPISDMHVKNYSIILCLKHFPGPSKFGPVFWSRFFRRGPVEYNYPFSLRKLLQKSNKTPKLGSRSARHRRSFGVGTSVRASVYSHVLIFIDIGS